MNNFYIKGYMLCLLHGLVVLTSTGYLELEVSTGSLSGSTILTCNAINFSFSTLEWFMNDTVIAKYSIDSKDQYPVTVPADPFVVKLMDVIITGGLFNFINFTLITDVCNLLEFEGQSISCGTMQERSNSYNISLAPKTLNVTFTANYSSDKNLTQIDVHWKDLLANFECPFIITIYQVELDSGTNTSLMTRNTSNCPNKLCWVQFSNLMAKQHTRYEMKVVASYQFIDVCTSMTIVSTIGDDFIENDRCSFTIKCPISINESCSLRYGSEDQNKQVNNTFTVAYNTTPQGIPFKITAINNSATVIQLFNYTRTDTDGNYGAFIGVGVAAFVFGILEFVIGFVVGVFIYYHYRIKRSDVHVSLTAATSSLDQQKPGEAKPNNQDYYWVWKLLCVCSIIIFLMNIIVFGLWIASGGTSNEDSCGNERSLQGVLIKVATSLSLLLMICSTVLLGGYLIICRSQPTKLYSIEVPTSSSIKKEYDFSFAMTCLTFSNKQENTCATCEENIGIQVNHHYCEACGKRLCKACYKDYEVFIYHKLCNGWVCRDCNGIYWKQNEQFSNAGEDTIGEISCEWRSKITETCSVCEKDFDGETTTCKSCGKCVCNKDECHPRKIQIKDKDIVSKVTTEAETRNSKGEEVAKEKVGDGEKEEVVCNICYMLYKRKKHERIKA